MKKRGLIVESYTAMFSIFIIFFTITIFFILTISKDPSKDLRPKIEDKDLSILMNNILNTPIKINNQKMSIYKALFYWASDQRFDSALEDKLKEILTMAQYNDEVIIDDGLKECFTVYELHIKTNSLLSGSSLKASSPALFGLNKHKGCYDEEIRNNKYVLQKELSYGNIKIGLILYKYVLRK